MTKWWRGTLDDWSWWSVPNNRNLPGIGLPSPTYIHQYLFKNFYLASFYLKATLSTRQLPDFSDLSLGRSSSLIFCHQSNWELEKRVKRGSLMWCRVDERVEDSHYSQEYSLALKFKSWCKEVSLFFSRDGGDEYKEFAGISKWKLKICLLPLVFLGLGNIRLLSRSCANVTISARSR